MRKLKNKTTHPDRCRQIIADEAKLAEFKAYKLKQVFAAEGIRFHTGPSSTAHGGNVAALITSLIKEVKWLAKTPYAGNCPNAHRNYMKYYRDPSLGWTNTTKELYMAHAIGAYQLAQALDDRLQIIGLNPEPPKYGNYNICFCIFNLIDTLRDIIFYIMYSCTEYPVSSAKDSGKYRQFRDCTDRVIEEISEHSMREELRLSGRTPYWKDTYRLWLPCAAEVIGKTYIFGTAKETEQ